jgi:hypothetical protein
MEGKLIPKGVDQVVGHNDAHDLALLIDPQFVPYSPPSSITKTAVKELDKFSSFSAFKQPDCMSECGMLRQLLVYARFNGSSLTSRGPGQQSKLVDE